MKSVSMIKALLVVVALGIASVAMAEAPWVIDNIVKTGSVETTDPVADGSCLQIELKMDPTAKNVPWHNFKIVDVSGAPVGKLDSWDEDSKTLFFEGDWSKVVGLYLEGMGNRQELFPNAVVQDVEPVKPVVPAIKPAVVNNVPSYPLRYEEPIARTERHVIDNVERVVNVHRDGVRTYYDGHRDVYVDDRNHVVHHGGDVYHDDVHHTGGGHGGHGGGHGHGHGHSHGDVAANGGSGGGCGCGHCDGNHGDGCTCSECSGTGDGDGKGSGKGPGSGAGDGCKYCGGSGCAKCGNGPGSPWEMDAYAKNVGQGNKLAMGNGKGAYGEEAPGCGCGEGKGPGTGEGEGTGDGDGDDCGCGEGEGPAPDEGTEPAPGDGEGPAPDEGEGPLPDETEAPAPGEGCGCGPEPGPNPMEPPTGPEPNAPAPGPAPGTAPGMGPGGPGAYGPNMVNLAPQVRPRVKNLAKNFFKKPPVIDGPEIYVFNPQKPYYNPQVPYYGYNQPGYGYGGGGYGAGGGGGAYGDIPEGAFDFKKPEYEDHFVLYISTGNDKSEGIVYQVDEHGRVLGQVKLPYTATGLAMHRDTGLVCAAPRDGGKIYRINDAGKMETVMENNEDVVHPSDVAIGYNSDSMVLADDLTKTLTLSNTAGVKPTTYKRLQGSKYEQPKMSVAAGRDKAVLFSSDDNPGVYRYTANATESEPVLPKSGAVAASNANDHWAATQDNSIVVLEGTQEQYSFDVPSSHRIYKKGMLSFAPRDAVVTAVQQADGDRDPWLMMFRKDDDGETRCRSLFKWDEQKYGEMQDFVVGPRMYWEQNERKTMKSMY